MPVSETKRAFEAKSFGTGEVAPDPAEQEGPDRQQLTRRSIILAGSGVAAGLLCMVMAVGQAPSSPAVTAKDATQISSLRSQIAEVKGERGALPSAKDADRNLVKAQEATNAVAQLQNDYRPLAAKVDEDGHLDASATEATARTLISYFDPSISAKILQPWYLLAADKSQNLGIGIPETFNSGFQWQAQTPYEVGTNDTIPVSWVAVQTHPAKGQSPQVLAWARADYNMTRQIFVNVRVGTTASGQDLGLEVAK